MIQVSVIDYGAGNLGSVVRIFEDCGATVAVVDTPVDIQMASALVLPGVGAFADGMDGLTSRGLALPLKEAVLQQKVPLIGFCLGMQLLAEYGNEFGVAAQGLGLINGSVIKLSPTTAFERIPHVGWNSVHKAKDSVPLLEGIPDGTDFYFAHSYFFSDTCEADVAASTPYCGTFPSIVRKENIWGTQFHPEKSSFAGKRLIMNFLEFAAKC